MSEAVSEHVVRGMSPRVVLAEPTGTPSPSPSPTDPRARAGRGGGARRPSPYGLPTAPVDLRRADRHVDDTPRGSAGVAWPGVVLRGRGSRRPCGIAAGRLGGSDGATPSVSRRRAAPSVRAGLHAAPFTSRQGSGR
ncbi:hypothetical protein THAOC_35337, partial [Thalassiosira oceanica]